VRSTRAAILSSLVALCLAGADARAQGASTPSTSGLQAGPATVPVHWSKNKYPSSIPDGAAYYLVEKGDTLWDLSQRFLGNPFLWPQIWNENKYIADAHWIYPGDPIIVPKVGLVSETAGEPGEGGLGEEGEGEGAEGAGGAGGEGSSLYAVTEENTIQCAAYVTREKEDESLQIIGSEGGATRIAFGEREILYLGKGTSSGIKAGDVFTFHRPLYPVKHPVTGKNLGEKVEVTGWGRVVLAQENASTIVVEHACIDIHAGDYLKTFEKATVPLTLRRDAPDRLTPATGKVQGYIVDIGEDAMIAATGQLVTIDLGSDSGIAPGSTLVVYKVMYPSVPTPRNVLGEIVVIATRDRTATAKILSSNDAIMNGDQVELR
jgi:LysM domain